MDVDLARTFLAVVETGSFVEAAKRVFVTQSTVSMRVKTLEDRLGRTLFDRSKAGATLTAAGNKFHKHALTIVRAWQQARVEVALPEGYLAALTVGGQYSLWDGFLIDWLSRMRKSAPDIAIRAQFGTPASLMQWLTDGTLDFAVMYTPQSRPGYEVELLFEEELILVSSETRSKQKLGESYIYVDWGPEFRADHSLNFPDTSSPSIFIELGSLALNYLLKNKASGYFPKRLAAPYLQSGQIERVASAPAFHYPAYAVYSESTDASLRDTVLKSLRGVAAKNRQS